MAQPPNLDHELRPIEFCIDRGSALRIRWADGHVSELPLAALRRACPCAACRAIREAPPEPLRVLQRVSAAEDMVQVEAAELVGRYALRIRWKDGHDTGIYDYRTLRGLG